MNEVSVVDIQSILLGVVIGLLPGAVVSRRLRVVGRQLRELRGEVELKRLEEEEMARSVKIRVVDDTDNDVWYEISVYDGDVVLCSDADAANDDTGRYLPPAFARELAAVLNEQADAAQGLKK